MYPFLILLYQKLIKNTHLNLEKNTIQISRKNILSSVKIALIFLRKILVSFKRLEIVKINIFFKLYLVFFFCKSVVVRLFLWCTKKGTKNMKINRRKMINVLYSKFLLLKFASRKKFSLDRAINVIAQEHGKHKLYIQNLSHLFHFFSSLSLAENLSSFTICNVVLSYFYDDNGATIKVFVYHVRVDSKEKKTIKNNTQQTQLNELNWIPKWPFVLQMLWRWTVNHMP